MLDGSLGRPQGVMKTTMGCFAATLSRRLSAGGLRKIKSCIQREARESVWAITAAIMQ